MNKENFFNLLDFGSSKIRFSVFDKNKSEKYSQNITVLTDEKFSKHFIELNNIIKKAEKKISFHIEDLILFFDSADLFTIDISFNKNLDIKKDVKKVYNSLKLELKQTISTYYENLYLAHIIMDSCIVDNKKKYLDFPVDNITASNFKVDFKVICFPKKHIVKLKNYFLKNNLKLSNIFCTSYIKTKSYVKKLGEGKVSFLDIGLERTSLVFYENKKFQYIQTIPIGGSHITKDISKIFKITIDEAESIKRSFNKTETEFSYENKTTGNEIFIKDIENKNISINLLKKVILYRVQEIIDLTFKKSEDFLNKFNLSDAKLFLIGDGSIIFKDNSFYLNDNFGFNSISYYSEKDRDICNSGLVYHLDNYELPRIINKNQGLFEKFFNYFSK